MKLLIATGNAGKLREFQAALHPTGLELLSTAELGINDFPEETGSSYAENALIKARFAAERSQLVCLGDDSGLEVEALSGAPGLYSARYGNKDSDAARRDYLLAQLEGTKNPDRNARFVCALALVTPAGASFTFSGECQGRILEAARGENGFGYDPLFYSFDLKKSFAEAGELEKRQVSHRGRAIRELETWLLSPEGIKFRSGLEPCHESVL